MRAEAEHPVPVDVGWACVIRMKGKFESMQAMQVGACVPGQVDANQRDISKGREGVTEDANWTPVGGNVEILCDPEVLEMIELESSEVGGGRSISEVLAGDLLARVVSNFEMEGTPERHMWTNQFKDRAQLVPVQRHARDMLLARNSVHHDIQSSTRAPSAALQVRCSPRQMRLLPEAQRRPEFNCPQCNVAPVMADMRHRQLEECRWHCMVLLVRPQ